MRSNSCAELVVVGSCLQMFHRDVFRSPGSYCGGMRMYSHRRTCCKYPSQSWRNIEILRFLLLFFLLNYLFGFLECSTSVAKALFKVSLFVCFVSHFFFVLVAYLKYVFKKHLQKKYDKIEFIWFVEQFDRSLTSIFCCFNTWTP